MWGCHGERREDRLARRCSWELRKTFTDVFYCVLDFYKTQSYLLMHHSGTSMISEKRSTDPLFWAISWMSSLHYSLIPCWRSCDTIPTPPDSCQWHFCPCGPCHSLKRLFICPRSTHKHTLLNAVAGGRRDFAAGMGIGNSEHVLFCCPGEHWLLKGDWSVSKVNERMEKTDQHFYIFTHLFGKVGKTNVSNYFRQLSWVNDKAFWHAGNNCFPSRVFRHLKGNKPTLNL